MFSLKKKSASLKSRCTDYEQKDCLDLRVDVTRAKKAGTKEHAPDVVGP